MGLGIEDFKTLLLDLYLAQREIAQLRAQLAAQQSPAPADGGEPT